MNWTFTPQVQGLEGMRLPYDPIDVREQTKFENIMAEGIMNFFFKYAWHDVIDIAVETLARDLGLKC